MVNEAVSALPDNVFLLRIDPEIAYSDELNATYQAAGFTTRNVNIKSMHGNIQPRKNVVLYYDGIESEDDLMRHFKSDYRNQIRRAAKDGVVVTWGSSPVEIDEFFDLYVKMAQAQGITHRPKSYFDLMRDLFADTGLFRVFVAKLDDVPIAAGIGFSHGDEIWYMYAGSDRQYAKHYGPYAVQWEMLKWGLAEGKKQYDFGGVGDFVPEDGLYKFKHGFAYHDEPAEYIGEIDWVVDETGYQEYLKQFAD
jgi:lipid II:glycine glycyltransferase (peptidoglycan interpeptide bridge formation enzyme)